MNGSPNPNSSNAGNPLRLVAFSLIILSGAVAMGLGSLSENPSLRDEVAGFGLFVLFAGILLTAGELYLMRFFQDVADAIFQRPQKPPEDRSPESPHDSPPPPPPL